MRRFWSLHDRGQIRRVFKETKIEVLPARCGRRRREIRVSEQDQAARGRNERPHGLASWPRSRHRPRILRGISRSLCTNRLIRLASIKPKGPEASMGLRSNRARGFDRVHRRLNVRTIPKKCSVAEGHAGGPAVFYASCFLAAGKAQRIAFFICGSLNVAPRIAFF